MELERNVETNQTARIEGKQGGADAIGWCSRRDVLNQVGSRDDFIMALRVMTLVERWVSE